MKRFVLFASLALILVAATAMADTRPQMVEGGYGTHTGQAINMSKAAGDTIYLIGDPQNPDQVDDGGIGPVFNGTFQDQFGNPMLLNDGMAGSWTSDDLTFSAESYWNVSDFQAVNGSYSYWCGTEFADGDVGYGNDWNQVVLFSYQVPDNAVSNTVTWSAIIQNDTEPGYDYTYMEWNQDGIWNVLVQMDGNRTFEESHTFTYNPGDYVGSGADEIQLRFRVASDGAWSDEDDLWETNGACQVDDVEVIVDGTQVDFEDFEDQVADNWVPDLLPGVGDYAELYVNLQDEDPCRSNFTPQVGFIDTPDVGPAGFEEEFQAGQTWRYGPGGYIVNNQGGPAGPDFYINNIIISPVLEWPAGAEACEIEFGVFRHEELGAFGTWPGMFYQWHVRSVNTGNPADLEGATWENRNFVQYGGPDYTRQNEAVTDLLANGRTHMQLSLRVIEYGYVWGWVGTDGTPAPYFDNIQVRAYPFAGPGIAGRPIDWLQDNFPATGDIDLVNLENNSVPLDAAQNIAGADDLVNYPGDSMWFDVSAVRGGSVLNDEPRVYVRMKANPLFDPYRTNVGELMDLNQVPNFFEDGWTLIEGYVETDSTFQQTDPPTLVEDRWNVSLPDEGFFFPGDVLKWYVRAEDNVAGDIGVSLFPADTSGFASFEYNLDYPVDWIVRALPTINSDTPGDQPTILFWNDFVDRGGDNEWLFALNQLGYKLGVDYDMYATNGPSSGVGNGLGGRATSAQLTGYSTLLYTSGDLSVNLLANGDFDNDPSNDLNVVTNWFAQGDKNAFFTGDELVRGLLDAGSQGSAFVNTYLSVNYIQNSVGPLIGNQTAPLVKTIAGNSILTTVDEWIAYGGCLGINSFDAVEAVGNAERIAEFTDANGNPGQYTYAAGIYNAYGPETADVVYMPYDFFYIYNAPGWTPPDGVAGGISARALILRDILDVFGENGTSPIIGADLPDAKMQVRNFPNPFNPSTTIKLNLPRAGEVSLKIFNVRGELVRTLVDGQMTAGEHSIIWDGKSDAGNQAASGVYFYETRANGEVKINKMALVK
ncbi:T9SS type A sorting domain-containing protein [bacterium]|nr:T9SS type A sorting domain-containing protein [bacterium]